MPDGKPASDLTLLALDFGRRRIGVAVGQTVTGSASPAGTIQNGRHGPDYAELSRLLRQWRPAMLVVGMPLRADGQAGEMRRPIAEFVASLWRYKLPVAVVDEAGTSIAAEEELRNLRAAGRARRVQKGAVDQAAAVLIAERCLADI